VTVRNQEVSGAGEAATRSPRHVRLYETECFRTPQGAQGRRPAPARQGVWHALTDPGLMARWLMHCPRQPSAGHGRPLDEFGENHTKDGIDIIRHPS
jgi:hypothetical protein